MSDDPKKTSLDGKLVSIEQEHERRYWSESLGCTVDKLLQAVQAVGHSAEAVRRFVERKR